MKIRILIKKICMAYQYFFYKCYRVSTLLTPDEYSFNCYKSGWLTLSFLNYINFLALSLISEILTGYGFSQIGYSKTTVLIPGVFFFILNYFIFIYQEKYKKIIKKFENESKKSRTKGTIFSWIYVVLSFMLPIFLINIERVLK
jgi:hypothetical protein